jgi:glutamyl-tRNA(Gln) amidotransferase subunit E
VVDYEKLGLMVGLEVHQELATEHKLFCSCPPRLFKDEPEYTFLRRLRPSQSELGEVDPAALFEFLKGKTIIYEANRETSCLVEMDEEPPGPLNGEALDISLTFSLMTGGRPVDEVQVMRKIVVDGSNTTGFQRTCVTAIGGSVEAGGKVFGLQQVALEEDAARKMGEEGDMSLYRIDRLGIPLIEVATDPDIRSPAEAELVARRIGGILRSTGMVRRGLGSIRQDVNVSIRGGAVIEIKGVQDLNILATVVEYEAMRQSTLLEIAGELGERAVQPEDLGAELLDVSDLFEGTGSRILKGALKRGGKVMAIRLPGFAGLVGKQVCPNRRLGTEMAGRAKFSAGVRGIFHTDELPGYSITGEEVSSLRERTGASEGDAVVIVADEEERCRKALAAVVERAVEAFDGVPQETRSADPDGTTHFTRPRPGAARMYPETDVLCVPVTGERLDRLRSELPEMPEARLERFKRDYDLNEKLARQITDSDYMTLFEEMAGGKASDPTLLAVTFTETFTSLARDGVDTDSLTDDVIKRTFDLLVDGKTAKESLPPIFTWLTGNPEASPLDALKALGLSMLTEEELRELIESRVAEKREVVERMGERAMGPLMGVVMKEVRGRAEARDVQRILREALAK